MSDNNGHLPEWLRELGTKVDALLETAKIHQGMLDDVVTALEHQRAINDEHRRELDEHAQHFDDVNILLQTARRQQAILDDILAALRQRREKP